jgi:hypothetical protein
MAGRIGRTLRLSLLLSALVVACSVRRHDLVVVNTWDRGINLYLVSQRAGLPDQYAPLGAIRGGATEHFSSALPADAEQFRFRLVYHSDVYEESATVCVTREGLERNGWRLTIPDSPSSCRSPSNDSASPIWLRAQRTSSRGVSPPGSSADEPLLGA